MGSPTPLQLYAGVPEFTQFNPMVIAIWDLDMVPKSLSFNIAQRIRNYVASMPTDDILDKLRKLDHGVIEILLRVKFDPNVTVNDVRLVFGDRVAARSARGVRCGKLLRDCSKCHSSFWPWELRLVDGVGASCLKCSDTKCRYSVMCIGCIKGNPEGATTENA